MPSLLLKLLAFAACASALRVTRRGALAAAPKLGAAAAAAALLPAPAVADEEVKATASSLKPLYQAAQKFKLTRRSTPGEVAVPEAFEQGMESPFIGRYTDPNHPGGFREVALLETQVGIYRLAKVTGGGGRGEPASFELPALVYGDTITVDVLPVEVGGRQRVEDLPEEEGIRIPAGTSLPEAERRIILDTLRRTDGNKTAAARILGIGLRTLYRKLEQYEAAEGPVEPAADP